MHRQNDEARRQSEQMQRQAEEVRRQADDARRHGEELQRQNQKLAVELEQANGNLRRLKEETGQQMQRVKSEADNQRKQFEDQRRELEGLRKRAESAVNEREHQKAELSQMRERANKVEAEAKAQRMVAEKLEKAMAMRANPAPTMPQFVGALPNPAMPHSGPAQGPGSMQAPGSGKETGETTIHIHGGTVHIHMGGPEGAGPKIQLHDGAKMFGAERKPDALLPPQVEEKRRITSFEAPARALPPGLPTTGNNQRVFEIREGAGEGTTFGIDPSGKRLVLRKVDTKVKKGSEDEDDEDEDDEENESAKPAPKPPVKAKAPEVKKPDMKKIRLF